MSYLRTDIRVVDIKNVNIHFRKIELKTKFTKLQHNIRAKSFHPLFT